MKRTGEHKRSDKGGKDGYPFTNVNPSDLPVHVSYLADNHLPILAAALIFLRSMNSELNFKLWNSSTQLLPKKTTV